MEQSVALTIATVEGNKTSFTKREAKQAELARRLQTTLLFPNDRHLQKITEVLQDCPVTPQDVANAKAIFGPSIGQLKGKTTPSRSIPVTVVPVKIPNAIREDLKTLHLHADICFVNGIGFIVSITEKIKFCTSEAIGSRTDDVLVAALKKIQSTYRFGGFRINVVSLDGEFTTARERIRGEAHMDMNPVSAGEHAPVIERHIRHMKEGVRGLYQMLPFDKRRKLPERIIIELVHAKTFYKNAVPALDGISDVIAPREIITQQRINYKRHCSLVFGQYVQTHEEHDNSMKARTIGAIAMRPTGARQGGYFFFNLSTGRLIRRNHWTECAMPQDVIERVHRLARQRDKIGIKFCDRTGKILSDDEQYNDYSSESEDGGINCDENDDAVLAPAGVSSEEIFESAGVDEEGGRDPEDAETEQPEAAHDLDMEERYGPRTTHYNLRRRKAPRYDLATLLAMGDISRANAAFSKSLIDATEVTPPLIDVRALGQGQITGNKDLSEVVMTQYSLNKGLKVFGEQGSSAVQKQMQQIHDRKVILPKNPRDMDRDEKSSALWYLMFLKRKQDGSIKGRGCADGRKQRHNFDKDSTSSPTISTEALFLVETVAAKESRRVTLVDVPGAYLQTELEDEKVIVKFEGRMAELLEMIDPKMYQKYITIEGGRQVLYAELAKVLYGILRGALLFWQKISAQLVEWGFTINPYDWCVANKDVAYELSTNEGSKVTISAQMTLGWHVDDFIITHKDQGAIDAFVSKLNLHYGQTTSLKVHNGQVHEYLGMTLYFTIQGKVKILMREYVEDLLSNTLGKFTGRAASPASAHLFDVNPQAKGLSPDQSALFHHLVAKCLFMCKRARPDIQLAVGFLCGRVKAPDMDDWKKPKRLFQYIRATKELYLTVEADDTMIAKWWIDASFAVHADCRSHSGATFSLGKGTPYAGCRKQKVNGKSSTEVELIAVDDFIGQVLWTKNFLCAQGYAIKKSVGYQDNQSAILLENNGRMSGSKRTRHINIRYYFITDRINQGEVGVEYCPTGEMKADFFTKPLQGTAFRKFRDAILNVQS